MTADYYDQLASNSDVSESNYSVSTLCNMVFFCIINFSIQARLSIFVAIWFSWQNSYPHKYVSRLWTNITQGVGMWMIFGYCFIIVIVLVAVPVAVVCKSLYRSITGKVLVTVRVFISSFPNCSGTVSMSKINLYLFGYPVWRFFVSDGPSNNNCHGRQGPSTAQFSADDLH